MKVILFTFVFILLVLGSAVAQNDTHNSLKTGNDLLYECRNYTNRGSSTFGDGVCLGYIAGVGDSVEFCGGDNITYGQIVRVVLKYMDDHPEQLNQDTITIVRRALLNAFPCSK